jgi:hypothetical protein
MASDSGYNVITITGGVTGALQSGTFNIGTGGASNFTLGDAAGVETFFAGAGVLTSGWSYLGLATTAGTSGFYASKSGVTYYFTKQTIAPGASVTLTADTVGAGGADFTFCFMPGTLIRTPAGEAAVESLAIGDLVLTATGETRPIRWIGRQTVSAIFADPITKLPVRIKAGALAENVPSRDLLVSPGHALLIDGALIQAGALVNGSSIIRDDDVPATFTYHHIETADHSIILAENTPAETFVDNATRASFDNAAEYEARFADTPAVAELDLPRALSHRQVPMAVRQRLAARAAEIFGAEAAAAA